MSRITAHPERSDAEGGAESKDEDRIPMLMAGTLLGSWLVFELVRRTRVTRALFGMKP